MYELDGKEYSLEDITAAAEESNLAFEDYIAKAGIVKENGVAETDASVAPEENTASNLDPGFSDSTKIDNSKEAIIARRNAKSTQSSSDPLDYANYDIGSDSFILPEELEEVVITAKAKPLKFSDPDYFGKKAAEKEEKKKSKAKKTYNDQVKAIGGITNVEYNNAAAKIYFDTSDKKIAVDVNGNPIYNTNKQSPSQNFPQGQETKVPVYETNEEFYKRVGKYDDFLKYEQAAKNNTVWNGPELDIRNDWQKAQIQGKDQLQDDTLNRLNIGVDEGLQSYVEREVDIQQENIVGQGITPNLKNANQALLIKSESIENEKISLDKQYSQLENISQPFIESSNKSLSTINKLSNDFRIDPLDVDSMKPLPSQRIVNKYNEAVQVYNANQNQLKDLKFNDLIKQYTKRQDVLDGVIKQYNKDIDKFGTDQQIMESLGYDYDNMNRLALNIEQFFGGNLTEVGADIFNIASKGLQILGDYRGPYELNPSIVDLATGEEVIIQNETLNNVNNYLLEGAADYNRRIDKDMKMLSKPIKLSDVGKNGVTSGDLLAQTFVDVAPSTAVSFTPVLGLAKNATMLSRVGKAGGFLRTNAVGGSKTVEALRKAKQSAQNSLIASQRLVMGTFFAVESGGQARNLRNQLESSYKILEKGSTLDKQIKELQLNYNVLNSKTEKTTEEQAELERIKIDLDKAKATWSDQDRIQNLPRLQKALNTYSYGATGAAWEYFPTKFISKPMQTFIQKYGKESVKRQSYEGIKKYWQALKSGGGVTLNYAGKALLIENGEELGTEITQKAFSATLLGENVNMFENITPEFFLQNSVSIFSLVGGRAVNGGVSAFKAELTTGAEIKQTSGLVKRAMTIYSDLTQGNYTSAQAIEARGELETIVDELAIQDGINFWKSTKLSQEELLDVGDQRRIQRQILRNLSGLGVNTDPTDPEVVRLAETLKKKYKAAGENADNLLGEHAKQTDKRIKEWREGSKLDSRVKGNVADVDLTYEFSKNEYFTDISAALSSNKIGQFSTIQEFEQFVNENNFTQEQKESLYSDFVTLDKDNKKVLSLDNYGKRTNYGFTLLNQYAINAGIAAGDVFAATTPLEELNHEYNIKNNIVKDGKLNEDADVAINEIIEKVKEYQALGRISKEQGNTLIKRFDKYFGDLNEGQYDAEEVLVQLNNAIMQGVITQEFFDGMFGVKPFLNNLIADSLGDISWMMNLKTPQDVFKYLKKFRATATAETQTQLSPPEQEDTVEKASLTGFGAEIDAFKPAEGQTLEQYKQDPNYFKAYEAIGKDNEALNTFILKTGRQYGIESNLDVQAIKDNLQLRFIKNYDPSKNPSLFGWMTSGKTSPVRGAVLDQIKAVGQTPTIGAQSFDVAQGETGAAPILIAEEVSVQETIKAPKSQLKQEAPQLIDKAVENEVETAVLEIAEGVFPDVETKEFLPFIKEVIAGKLTDTFKNKFGTREQYDNFIDKIAPALKKVMPASFFVKLESTLKPEQRQFTTPPVRLTTQADIDKARDNEQINYLENDAQGVNLYKLKKFTPKELASFINPPAISPKTGKKSGLKGTRKTSVATSIATQSAFDMIPSIFKGKVSEFELAKISEKIQRDPRIKFSKGLDKSIQELFKLSNNNPNFDLDLAGINKLNTLLKSKKLNETLDLKKLIRTPEGRKEIVDNYKWIMANLGPRDMWFGKRGKNKFTTSGSDYGVKGVDPEGRKALEILRDEINVLGKEGSGFKFGESIDGVTDYSVSSYSTLLGNNKNANAKNKNGDIDKFNTKVRLIHEGMWNRIYNLIGDNKKNAPIIGSYLKLVANHTGHWHKMGAEIVGWSTNPKGIGKTLYEYEHAMPATAAYLYLMDVALNQTDFKPAYNAVMDNYKLIALDKAENAKLGKAGLGRGMPEGWMLGDNYWWQRYFNEKMATIEGGINPGSIMFTNGRTFEDQLQINSAGQLSKPALIKAQQNVKNKINVPILRPAGIKFSKSDTNQNVLNEMQRLDTEAQDARIKYSKGLDLNEQFNFIIQKATGIGKEKQYGQTKARAVGADKGKWDWAGIPPSAQDFVGLTRYFAGKGKEGDKTIAWVKENFLDPFARANIDISNAQVSLANDFKGLKKLLGISPKDLNKKIPGEPYTIGNAIRVYTWGQQGMKVPGLSKADQKILEDLVAADENLQLFANELIAINKDNGYPKPQDSWLAGTITTDLLSGLNTVVRAKYLKQWQNNVNEVFTEANMNKLEAAFGKGYRDALENMLGRMKTGSNRGFKGDTLTGRFTDWINGAVGSIMFFNMRSAVLQTISAVNFINLSDNNMFKAAAAFANQPQYWGDVVKLMNSDYLVQRRNGLKINVNEADIAEIAAESKNKAKAFINKLLKLGFLPTQIADSFAIASGGATFYRNRLKSLIKDGMSQKEAEAQAFQDFREIAEESQQSSRPDRISAQQAGPMGRIVLAFANTPAQYARLMQKAASDLKNRRGDDKTNISKIIYYGAIQNVIFNALQQALFAMAFGDEEPDEEKKNKKYIGILNGMSDSLLRGIGFHGAAISTLKNVIMKLADGAKAQDAAIEMLDISPPVSSKIGKLRSAGRTWDWNKKEIIEKGWSLDNPAYLAAGQVVSAATNVPLDRGIRKLQNLKDASDAENEEWMRVANALGWAKWELEWQKDKPKKKKDKTKKKLSWGSSSSKVSW